MVHLEEVHQFTSAGTAGDHDDDDHQQQQLTVAVNGGSGSGEEKKNKKKKKKKEKEKEKHEVVPQLRFPPGFRFAPSDMELLEVFLRGKIDGRKLPLELVFFEVSLLNWEPHKLVEARKAYGVDRWYFFTKREPSPTNKQGEPRRKLHDVVGVDAAWKATGSLGMIPRDPAEELVGTKRILTYDTGAEDDKWSMHEYILADKDQMDQFVLCTIQEKQNWEANGKRRKRKSDGSKKLSKPSKRKKNTAATTSQQLVEETEQEETTVFYSDPPPLSKSYQLALQEEHLMTPLPLLEQGQYNHHNYLVDVDTEDDTLAYDDGFGEPPLMMPQQHVYQASIEEMKLEATYGLNQSTLLFNYQYTSEHQLNAMDPVYSQVNTDQLCQQPTTQGCYQKTGISEDMLGCPLQPGLLETSPNTVFEGPEPLSYATPGDDAKGGGGGGDLVFLLNSDLNNYYDGNNLVGNNCGNDSTMASPDEGSEQALHMCQHGDEWRQRGDVMSVGIIWCCFLCGL